MPKQHLVNSLAVLLAAASPAVHAQSAVPNADPLTTLSTVVVKATADSTDSNLAGADSANADLAAQRAGTSDSARLLQDVPGLSLYGAGGISSLPAIHGLADDRLRIQVDGMDLMPACPNHMNSTLS